MANNSIFIRFYVTEGLATRSTIEEYCSIVNRWQSWAFHVIPSLTNEVAAGLPTISSLIVADTLNQSDDEEWPEGWTVNNNGCIMSLDINLTLNK